MAKTAPLSAEGRARQLAKEDRAPPRACAWCIETPPVTCALLCLLFCDPNSFHSALVQALVDSTRVRGERPHLLLASQDVRSDAGQHIFCRSACVTSPLICVVHPRNGLHRPVEWTGGERSPKKMESQVARHCADLRLCSKKSTYDIRPPQPMPGVRSEGGM